MKKISYLSYWTQWYYRIIQFVNDSMIQFEFQTVEVNTYLGTKFIITTYYIDRDNT